MLLDIGIIGSFVYWGALTRLFMLKKISREIVSLKYITLLTVLAFIEYAHFSGVCRGTLFWSMYFFYEKSREYQFNKID